MLLSQRQSLPLSDQQQISALIVKNAKQSPFFQTSRRVAFYQPVHGEVDCKPLIEYAWQQDKLTFLPILSGKKLQFIQYQPNQPLIENHYHIKEPIATPENRIDTTSLDLVFVPLVAFDEQMHRIGMGKGYYDRTFAYLKAQPSFKKPKLLGLAYEFQKLVSILPNHWDVPLHQVITEKQIY